MCEKWQKEALVDISVCEVAWISGAGDNVSWGYRLLLSFSLGAGHLSVFQVVWLLFQFSLCLVSNYIVFIEQQKCGNFNFSSMLLHG